MPATIDRIFLGWDAPALEAAAVRLADHYADAGEARMDRACVVLPGARAGRRLTELLLGEAERRSLRLVPPRVATVGALPELLHEPARPLAEPVLARRVWARALRDLDGDVLGRVFPQPPAPGDLRGWLALARAVERLHRELGGAGLRFEDVVGACRDGELYDDGERWAALAAAQEAYRSGLDALGRGDREFARIEAAEAAAVRAEQELWLVGIVELPGIVRRLLAALDGPVRALVHAPAERAGDFDAFGCVRPAAWGEAEIDIPDDRLALRDRPGDQAEAVLGALAALDGRWAADEITIGVPDESLVPHLEQRLAAAGLPARYAAGVPLARTGPYRLLAAAADYLDGRRFDALAALLRHPDLRRWAEGAGAEVAGAVGGVDACLGTADLYFGEALPARLVGGLAGRGPRREPMEALRDAIEGPALLGGLGAGRRPGAEWMEPILELLVRVYGAEPLDRAESEQRRIVEACARIRGVADELHRLPAAVDDPCEAPEAIRLLLAELERDALPAPAESVAIELLGWLELHLDDAPVLVVTGMNEPYVPDAVTADLFLPNALRTRLGLVDNDERYARDAYALTAMLHSRPEVRLIAGRRDGAGDPLRPSRLLFAAPPRTVAERVRRFYGAEPAGPAPALLTRARPGAESRFTLPPERELAAPEPIDRLRVTDFAAFLADPYRFALERILRLEPVDDAARELDGARFGGLAHEVLHRFGTEPEAGVADPAPIRRRLDALLDQALDRRYGRHALPAVRVQAEQLRARLHAFAAWQARWVGEGWRIAALEVGPPGEGVPFDVDGEPVLLRGRIDRIDHHPATGAWAVFDYKTSDAGDPPEKTHRAGLKKDRRWVDLQLPLYRTLLPALRRADGAPLVPPGDDDVRLGYILLPRELEAVGPAFAEWTADDLAAAEETARGAVRSLRENRFAFTGERVRSWRGDPLAALLGVHQLVSALDEAEEGGAA